VAGGAVLWNASCGKTHAYAPVDMETVMQAVRTYGDGHHPSVRSGANGKPGTPATSKEVLEDSDSYQNRIRAMLSERRFEQLDKEAQLARETDTRYPGDVWKLTRFYWALSAPTDEEKTSDAAWEDLLGRLRKWTRSRSSSAAARIAMAETFVNYAWHARGEGYADSVTNHGRSAFEDRLASAKSVLVEASKLKEKCLEWYQVMFNVALGEGWDKAQARELLDQAVAFEPGYHYFYTDYARFILPKWYGEKGEAQAFAEEVSQRVGGLEGSILYYEIATEVACQCEDFADWTDGLSWPKLKQGFEDFDKTYGATNLSQNRIAYMAFAEGDKARARQAFQIVGFDWDNRVWKSSKSFENARFWAISP
jgi:hypothetical protein